MAARWIFLLISLLLPHGLIFQGPMANFPVSDCGVSKRCVGSPDSGCLRSGICRELLKYSYDTNADKVRIELFGTPPAPGSTNFWVALGVNQQQGQMAGTLVSECVYNNGAVQAFASFNADSGYSNRRLPPGQEKLGISNDRGAFSNGILSCSFLLDRVRTTNGHDFALDTPLYLVLGDGPADGNTIKPHQTTPWTSEQPLVLTMGQPQTSFPNLQGLQTIAPVRTTAGQAVPLTAGGFIRQSAAASAPPAAITGCAALKGCLAEPAGCLDNGNCNTVASYRLDPNRPGEMVFELWRVMAPAGDQYVAMGLNPTSPSMPGTGVTACVYAQSSVDVLSSYNPFYFSMPIDNPKEGITVMQTGADGSHLYCQFSLQSKKSFRGNFSDSPVEIDLNNPLYFFVAYGQAMPSGGLTKHSVMPSTSTGQVSLAAFPNATTNGTEFNSTMTAFDIAPVAQNLTTTVAIPSEGLTRQATPPTAITDCNVLKGCLAEPPGCLNRGNCNSVVSYRVNPASPGELMFELWRVMASSGDQYIAMGVNPTAPKMSDTFVLACVKSSTDFGMLAYINMGHRPIRQLMDDDDITVHETALDFPYIYCRFSHKARVINKRTGFQLPVESLAFLISVRGPVRSGEISKHSGRPTITYTPISLHFTPPVNDDLYTLHAGAYDIDLNESDTSNPSPKTLLSSSSLSEVQLASNTTATPDLSFVSMAVNSMSIFLPVFNPAITSFTGALLPSNISEAVNASAFFEFTMEGEFVPILENGTDGTGTNEYGTDGTGTNKIGTNGTGTNDNGTDGTETNKIGTNGTGTNETGKHENGTNGTDLFASFDLDPMTVVLDDADSYLGKITAGCGWEKGCMGHPDRCLNQTDPCHAVSTWRPSAHNRDEYIIELWRRADPKSREGKFVAIGFNAKSGQMAKTGVIACVDAQNTVDVLASYNPSYYSTAVDNPKEGITVLQAGADGTHLYCQFSVQSNKSFRGSFAGSPANVDLNNPLYMVLAYGPATPNGILRKHSTAPLVSSGQVRLTDVAVSGAANKDYYKAHAGLMVGAWMFLASVGIFTARYYKPMWPGTKPCGLPVWFHIHRPIMILAISAAIAAFVLIFVQVRAWTATPVSVNPHPIIGIIAFGLGLIQPIMAIFRPHPGTANRPIFNWAHRLVGFSAHILAIAAIFLGLMMPQMNVLGGRDYGAAFWIMVAYAAFHVLWLILLQLIDWIAPLVGGGRRTTTMQMKTVNGHGTVYEETVIQEPVKAPASTLKTILWFTHFIVVAGLTIAILVLIGIST